LASFDLSVVTGHERRFAALDPLLPVAHPLPDPGPDDVLLAVDGAVGIGSFERPDPGTIGATWGTAEQHRLLARVGGPEPVAAMERLLTAWCGRVAARARPGDPESEAIVTWPSRDVAMTQLFLRYGLAPLSVIAVRMPGRPVAEPAHHVEVRPLRDTDLAAALELWLEVVRWDSQFNTIAERPSTADVFRAELRERLARPQPWSWVAGFPAEQVCGLLIVSPPDQAGWIAPAVSVTPAGYLGTLVVTSARRSTGVGAALVRRGHQALDSAGAGVTLLHYAGLNPLSGPFWHRCGYRPLWTMWKVRPASRLGVTL
jgi:GNAT superfamily N-acetyltransferase